MSFKENAQQLQAKLNREKEIWDGIDARIASAEDNQKEAAGIPTDAEATELKAIQKEIKELDAKCAESKEYEMMRSEHESMRKMLEKPSGRPDYGNGDPRRPTVEQKSVGQQFVEMKEFKDWFTRLAPSGVMSDTIRFGDSPALEAKNLITGASLTRATGGSGIVRPDYQGIVPLFLRPLTLRDVISVSQTGSDLIEFTAITAFDNQAAPTAEASAVSAAGVGTGGLKPQSGLNTVLVQAAVKTIPHWIPITRRALADAPQLQGYIDNFLMQGAEIKLEDQMITGNNVGENFQGLDNTPGITLQPFDTDFITTTRKARTKVRIIGRAIPTAYVMNPSDWETLDLTKNGQGNYYFGGPLAMGLKTLWGLPVIESEAVLPGTFYTGDMKQATLWDRERANIRISDSPNDFFLRNIVAILCELRAAFGVLRPAAIVRGDFTAGPNS